MSAEQDSKNTVSGTVEDIIYQNEDNGYTICDVSDEGGFLFTLCGNMPYLNAGDKIDAVGKWVIHPTYGRQFSVTSFTKSLPEDEDSIIHYLESGVIKGVGPKTARRIVKVFGKDTFDVIENNPSWLCEVPGISASRAEEISDSFKTNAAPREVMMLCSDYIGNAASMRVYQKWGGDAIGVLKTNPYVLSTGLNNIPFASVDNFASSLGFASDCKERIEAGIIYTLSKAASTEGHTCLPYGLLVGRVCEALTITDEKIHEVIDSLCDENKLVTVESTDRYVYLSGYRKAESYSAEKLKRLHLSCPTISVNDIGPFIRKAETNSGIKYAKKQALALKSSMEGGVLIITGGPGTGKTTIIKGIISIFGSMDFKIALCAPTGRAAKRMSEATGYEAKTIHRLLEMERVGELSEARFKRDENYCLDENVIIVDEFSMVDTLLFHSLLKAVKTGSRLILIGDKDQLPSVGPGNLLSDLLSSELFNKVELTEIFRQSEDSNIVVNAHLINEGKSPIIDNKSNDFFFMQRGSNVEIATVVSELISKRLPAAYPNISSEGIQIITPSKKGEVGTVELNRRLQYLLNPKDEDKAEVKTHDVIIRVGDRVMQNKNNYDVAWEKNGVEGFGVFNGEIGTVKEIDNDEKTVIIDFDSKLATYDMTMLDEIEHAYAITVHKSQGSEYPIVIIPMYDCPPMLKTRNLLYTAVTRAEKIVILVGKKRVIEEMISNDRQTARYTEFRGLLK